jgi:hypothetical protein
MFAAPAPAPRFSLSGSLHRERYIYADQCRPKGVNFESVQRCFNHLQVALSGTGVIVASTHISFTDVTAQSGRPTAVRLRSLVGDLNGDGYPDLYVSNHRTPDSLWLKRANGTFFDVGKQVLTWINHKNGDTHGGTWADFDNDGDQDLMVSNGTDIFTQFFVNKNADLVDEAQQLGVINPSQGARMPVARFQW